MIIGLPYFTVTVLLLYFYFYQWMFILCSLKGFATGKKISGTRKDVNVSFEEFLKYVVSGMFWTEILLGRQMA